MRKNKSKTYINQTMSVIDINILHEYYNRRFNCRSQNPLHSNRAAVHAYGYDNNMSWEKYLENVVKSGVFKRL